MSLVRKPFPGLNDWQAGGADRGRTESYKLLRRLCYQIRRLIVPYVLTCRLFNIQGTPVAGEYPRILLLMPARHYRRYLPVAGKDVITEHVWVYVKHKTPIKDNY